MAKKVAVVTGGTGGIGTAICQRLSQDNEVIACYFKEGKHEKARHWQEEQSQKGFSIGLAYANLSLFSDCEKLVAEILERYGQIDILVNNAGITQDATLQKMTPEQWQQTLDTNLTSVFNITRNALSAMLDQGYGRIISISSINGRKGQRGQCNYAASKAALFGFSKSLALEVAKKGITVNTLAPGYVNTKMVQSMRAETLEAIIEAIPMQRLGTTQEIAHAVAFLASPQAGFITGANLDINGGQYM